MITDKKVALKQLEKRFNFFCESLNKRIYGNIPLDYDEINKPIPLSPKLQEDKELFDKCKELAMLEVDLMEELIDERLKLAERNESVKLYIEERLKQLKVEPSLLEILDLIF